MELTYRQWKLLEPLIPQPKVRKDGRGGRWKSARLVLDGIVWILRTGAPWRYLPSRYPSYQTCHRRFQQWVGDGTLRAVVQRLVSDLGVGLSDEAFIDGSYAAAKNGGLCVGRCRAGRATKIMALADHRGLPLSVCIADGSRHDGVLTDSVLDASFVDELPPRLIGDKAWDSAKHQQALETERQIELIAPKKGGQRPSRRRQDGRALRRVRRRWKVERLFAWLKNFRRLVIRWEYKADNYLGMLYLGCIIILLRQL